MAKLGTFHQSGFARWVATRDRKIVTTRVPGHPQESEFGQNHPTISPNVWPCPKGFNFHKNHGFWSVLYHSPAPPPSLSPIQNCSGVGIKMSTWKGFFVSSVPHPAPSKAIARRGPYLKRTTAPAQSRQACLQKYVRYNQSAKGQLRFQRRGTKQARADYVREYALTDHGRAKRAQARAAYKARQKLVKRPSQNSKTAIP